VRSAGAADRGTAADDPDTPGQGADDVGTR
jgi:hypothetical protein